MKKNFPIIVEQDEDGVFIVECPALKGCRSYGYTIEEAMTNIREAIESCLEENENHITPGTFLGWREVEVAIP
jgi:predicted RNase H-like HicB family nuclease